MPARKGEEWNASIYARLTETPGGGRASAQIKMTFLDKDGTKLRTHESTRLTSVEGEYSRLEISGFAPAGTVAVRMTPVVSLQGERGPVSAYFDDACLASGEVVFESGFETAAVR
jgi:hypothetical protein